MKLLHQRVLQGPQWGISTLRGTPELRAPPGPSTFTRDVEIRLESETGMGLELLGRKM